MYDENSMAGTDVDGSGLDPSHPEIIDIGQYLNFQNFVKFVQYFSDNKISNLVMRHLRFGADELWVLEKAPLPVFQSFINKIQNNVNFKI